MTMIDVFFVMAILAGPVYMFGYFLALLILLAIRVLAFICFGYTVNLFCEGSLLDSVVNILQTLNSVHLRT